MKILIIIMLALFLSPVAAQSSGGYGKSGGYERSGGYESSGGYDKSGGYETSDSFLYGKSGGYASFKFQHDQRPAGTHRESTRMYDVQRAKEELKEGAWLKGQMDATERYRWIRHNEGYINRSQRRQGGMYGRFGSEGSLR